MPAKSYGVSPQGSGILPVAVAPSFNPPGGSYTSAQSVAISTPTIPFPAIYYTTDGSTPTNASSLYSSPIAVAVTETLKAIVWDKAGNFRQSTVASAAYTITGQVATPTFSPGAGTYSTAQTVTISCSTPSSTIYYTTNGTTPTTGSPVYSSPITVSSTETVQAIATAAGYTQSNVGSALYTIGAVAPSGGLVNWQPGVYSLSININSWTTGVIGANGHNGGGQNQYEIPKIAASIKAYPSIFKGYAPQYYWNAIDVDGTAANMVTAGVEDDFQKFVAACAAQGVTGYFAPNIAAFRIVNAAFTANEGSFFLPPYIYSGSTATYGTPSQGGSGAGWMLINYSGGIYGFAVARFDFPATSNAWINFWKNFGSKSLTATSGPYAGQAYTWGTHPQVAAFYDWTDPDIDVLNGNPNGTGQL